MSMPPTAPGVVVDPDMSAKVYHADPWAPSLSSTRARLMTMDGCPLMGKPGSGIVDEPTDAKDEGTAIHQLLLGRGDDIEVLDEEHKNRRTKAAKEAEQAARGRGKVPFLAHTWAAIKQAAERIRENLETREVDGEPWPVYLDHAPEFGRYSELVIAHQLQMAAGPIWARTRIDHIQFLDDWIIAYDLKVRSKRNDAHWRKMGNNIANEGYYVQSAAYMQAIEAAWPDYAGRVVWVWVFVESVPPYAVTAAEQDGLMRSAGDRKWAEACEAWADGVHNNKWPGYWQPRTLPSPGWLEHQERELDHG